MALSKSELQTLASKARRLRYKENDAECQPPTIAKECFHLFLSHVWGTGQDQVRHRASVSDSALDLGCYRLLIAPDFAAD